MIRHCFALTRRDCLFPIIASFLVHRLIVPEKGNNGTIVQILHGLTLPRSDYGKVERVLEACAFCLEDGWEYNGTSIYERGRHELIVDAGSMEEKLLADYKERS